MMEKKYSISLYILTQLIINYQLHSTLQAAVPTNTSTPHNHQYSSWDPHLLISMATTILLYLIVSLTKVPATQTTSQVPLRSHTCRTCSQLIPTFDHHCTLLNSCIHQKNRPTFLLYLMFQFLQITLCVSLIFVYQMEYGVKAASTSVLSLLIVLWPISCGMFGFHFWLMCVSLTTYEVIKGKKLWYLSGRPRQKQTMAESGLNSLYEQGWKDEENRNKMKIGTDSLQNSQKQEQREQMNVEDSRQYESIAQIQVFNQGILKNIYLFWLPLCRPHLINWKQYYSPKHF